MDKNKIIEAAAKLVAKGAYDKAIKEYQKVLEVDPKDIRVLQKMGELYQKKNDNAQAAHFFTKVAESYSSDGFFLKAVALYKQVLKLNPNLLEVNLKLAELHQQLGLMSEAMAYFQIVANHYDKAGDTKASLDTLKKMVDLDPENVASKIKLAELYARENMTKEAAQEFKRAAEYLKRNSRADDWLRVAERLSALEPENLPLAKELAASYLQRGDQKRALAKLQVCFKADGRDVETLTLLAQAFQGLGQVSKTVSVYKELAKIHQERGRTAESDGVWTQIELLDPQDPDLLARRGPVDEPEPEPEPMAAQEDAAPQWNAPAAAQPSRPAPAAPPPAAVAPAPAGMSREQLAKLLTETDVYVKYGLHDKALEHLRKVFAVDPENLDAHEKAYHIYVAANNGAQASEQLLNVLRLCTRRADVQRAQPYLASILQENPAHPEVPAFLSVLRSEGGVVAPVATPGVESLEEDAILVDSNDDEILVAEPPDDALAQPEGDELALAALSHGTDSDEIVDDEVAETTLSGEEAVMGEPISSSENAVYDLPPQDDLVVGSDDDALVLADEPGLGDSQSGYEDEPLVGPDDALSYAADSFEDTSGGDEPMVLADDPDGMSLGDEDEPPPTRVNSPSRALLNEAAPDTLQVPTFDDEDMAFSDPGRSLGEEDDAPTRVGLAPLDASALDDGGLEDYAPPAAYDAGSQLGDDDDEPTAAHLVLAPLDTTGYDEPEPEPEAEPEALADEPEPEAEPEEEPAAEECDEASFFLDQGLLEEAREILETIAIAFPGHVRAGELMARLEEAEAGGGAAPADEAPAEPLSVPSVQPVTEASHDEESGGDAFDLAAQLAGELDDLGGESLAAVPPADEDFQYSVDEVFAEFKKGLAKVVKPEDVDTHYDLGIAYKEMGLLDDAVHEFEVARQGSAGTKRELDCLTMIGMLHTLRGRPDESVQVFKEGLGNVLAVGEVAKALGFELASAYDALNEPGKALFHFQRVAAMDAKYRDVGSHVTRLSAMTAPEDDPLPRAGAKAPAAPPTPVPAAGAPKARKVGYV
ncbi:tetratricopeptide repeat protein [Corallococcus sp. bb12-1]|uniref:type IV pili formation protein SgmX n=1 Tax=Corallococcus sp. bb12-1 TaxID=2996784 RepID=UPI00227166D2|nr:tetratricopeptide repeat protein [Corallococcus sp. bb12-1]MCY1042551.1 tetratricopeptide repeat protein [Corallococcus sp. bb12-1]